MIPFPGRQLNPSRQNVRWKFAHRLFGFSIAFVCRGDQFPNPRISASCIYGIERHGELVPARPVRHSVKDGDCIFLRCDCGHLSDGSFRQLVRGTITTWKGGRRIGNSSEDTRDDGQHYKHCWTRSTFARASSPTPFYRMTHVAGAGTRNTLYFSTKRRAFERATSVPGTIIAPYWPPTIDPPELWTRGILDVGI